MDIMRHTSTLSDQQNRIVRYMSFNKGTISAREATADLDITSATLSSRICELERKGFAFDRVRKVHPVTLKKYTRYQAKGYVRHGSIIREASQNAQ